MTISATKEDIENKAREEAEARRRRILESAEKRMGIVEGSIATKTLDDSNAANSDDGVTTNQSAATSEDEGTIPATVSEDSSSAAVVPSTTTSTKSSGASKLAAARRRRFKNKARKETTTAPSTEAAQDAAKTSEATEPSCKVEEKANEPTESKPKNDAPVAEDKKNAEEEVTEKKKYLGVAKMRRLRIKEKAAAAKEVGAAKVESSSAELSSTMPPPLSKKQKRTFNGVPVLMHVLTVLLLVAAGLDVGLQQARHNPPGSGVLVHYQPAPRQVGLKILDLFPGGQTKEPVKPYRDLGSDTEEWEVDTAQDEFGTDLLEDDAAEENLDPLFRIDLDKLTEGPGLLNMLARKAIFVHRLILNFSYYLPKRIVSNVSAAFSMLVDTPPIPCLVAILLRQFVGKVILGAKLPDKVGINEQVVDSGQKDVIGMAKNAASAFISKAFPTAISLYSVWTHLRADIYILLFGVFVGLAWNQSAFNTIEINSSDLTGGEISPNDLTGGEL